MSSLNNLLPLHLLQLVCIMFCFTALLLNLFRGTLLFVVALVGKMGGDGGSTTNDRRFVAGTKNAIEANGKHEKGSLVSRQRERLSECAQSGQVRYP